MEVLEHVIINLTAEDLRRRLLIDRTKLNPPRTKGVHLSGVLRYLAYSPGGVLADGKAKSEPCDFEETYPIIVACGVMWEEFAVSLYPNIIWQPGERVMDGISGTPDGVTYGAQILPESGGYKRPITLDIIEEFKFTTKGIRPPQDVWWWVRQGLGYCALMGLDTIRWHVNWAHGGYEGKDRWQHFPIYTRTCVRFTEEEIDRWWKTVVMSKGKAIQE